MHFKNLKNFLEFQKHIIDNFLDEFTISSREEKNIKIAEFIKDYSPSMREHFCSSMCPYTNCDVWKTLISY